MQNRIPIAVASPKQTTRYGGYMSFSERMGLTKKDKATLKEEGLYRIEIEYSPYQKDSCMVVYKKVQNDSVQNSSVQNSSVQNSSVQNSSVQNDSALSEREVGFIFIQDKNGEKEYVLDCNIDYDVERDKVVGAIRTKHTKRLDEINWFMTDGSDKELITETDIVNFEAIRVAFRLKNSK